MGDVAIRVEKLGKRYRIGERERYLALRDVLARAVSAPTRIFKARRPASPNTDVTHIWALKDVSFEVRQGEVVGIIGRNGAGKTTLLKILAQVTRPTEGVARLKGRVGSLLEVGTGFHPELTGRENVYLNGAILGMKKAEIDRKFDEIVGFAEVEKFLDTPVKHYSSGMHVRLAFAVAAHLQPEILLIDEVLAVGDIEFQKKCIGRMEKVAHEGRTVAVVSHSMATIRALCERAILLEGGRVKVVGSAEAAVNEYLRANAPDTAEKVITDEEHDSRGGDKIRLRRVKLLNAASNCFAVYWRQPIMIRLEIEVREPLEGVSFGAGICLPDGGQILTVHHDDEPSVPQWEFAPSTYAIELTIENNLRPGIYRLHVGAHQKFFNLRNLFYVDPVTFEVLDHTQEGVVPLGSNTGLVNGRAGWGQPQRIEGGVHTSVA